MLAIRKPRVNRMIFYIDAVAVVVINGATARVGKIFLKKIESQIQILWHETVRRYFSHKSLKYESNHGSKIIVNKMIRILEMSSRIVQWSTWSLIIFVIQQF